MILFEAPGEYKEDNACESEDMLLGVGSLQLGLPLRIGHAENLRVCWSHLEESERKLSDLT